jgi:hypothetical protein
MVVPTEFFRWFIVDKRTGNVAERTRANPESSK